MTLNEVLKNTNYDVSLFSEEARKYVEDAIVVKTIRGKESLFIKCLKRDKEIALKPEEAVRQLYLYKLMCTLSEMHYSTRLSLRLMKSGKLSSNQHT